MTHFPQHKVIIVCDELDSGHSLEKHIREVWWSILRPLRL